MTTETNQTINVEFLYKELSYEIIGVLIQIHKELGPFAREKQYGDEFEKRLIAKQKPYRRELRVADSGNILDFIIEDKLVVEFKTVPYLLNDHYEQIKRYLFTTNLKLGLLINFRDKRISPKRVLNINNLRDSGNL